MIDGVMLLGGRIRDSLLEGVLEGVFEGVFEGDTDGKGSTRTN